MEEGNHTIVIKAWDAANNSSELSITFRVLKKEGLTIYNVINYPNPFTAHTSFRFEHNRPDTNLKLRIRIFTAFGKLVKTINETINTNGNRSSDINWEGTTDYGGMLSPGVYIYQLQVTSADGEMAVKSGKLVLL